MYESLGRQRGSKLAAGVHVRQIPVDAHRGNHWDFLRRHEQATRNAASGTSKQRREYATCLLARAADERNLMCAIEHLTQDGNKSPGPNGLRLEQLEPYEHWNLARVLSAAILKESYRPQPGAG